MRAGAAPWGVRVSAPGKINLLLGVGAAREDGYHDLVNVFQAVSLREEVRAREAEGFSVRTTGSVAVSGVPADDTNLAVRAARMLAEETGHRGGVRLEIVKRVPVAGGMGGGSADAAAALVACDALWGAGLSRDDLLRLAARLGADVPFALHGGTALGTGRGDRLSPVLAQGVFHWVLVLSATGLSTPEVYGELDRRRERAEDPPPRFEEAPPALLQALRSGDARLLAPNLANDLQAAAVRLAPELGRVLEVGRESGALAGLVSGSGPTVALLAEDRERALELQLSLGLAGLEAVHVTGPVHGARLRTD